MKSGGFDRIATIYDVLARLVFGESIKAAQIHFLQHITPQSKVLILGGGTGWLLEYLSALKPDCLVWYVEASEKMLELSKTKVNHSSQIYFILGTENDVPADVQFDVVITHFYLDLFTNRSLDFITEKIQARLKYGALWLITDFIYKNKVWQSILLNTMYFFFRTTCNIEATQLPDWNKHLVKKNLIKKESKLFFGEFIESTLYCNLS